MNALEKISEAIPKIDEKSRYIILGGVLILIFLVDYFLVMQPQLKTLRALNPKITLLAGEVKTAEENIRKIDFYQAELVKLRDKVDVVNRRIMGKEEVPLIMEKISRIARNNSVKIDQIMPLKGSEEQVMKNNEGKYLALPIRLDARSGYHDFGRFLNEIERNDTFFNVSNFTFMADGNDNMRHVAKLTLKVVIFEKNDEESK